MTTASKSPEVPPHQPVIAEATSSADDVQPLLQQPLDSPEPSTSNFIADDDDDIASHVELSSDGMPTQWYHQKEHDYLKNIPEMEPESSGMDMDTVGDIVDDTAGIELIENDNAVSMSPEPPMEQLQPQQQIITTARITNYDTELPQEIFHKSESPLSFSPNNGILLNNYIKQEEPAPVVVVADPSPQFNQVMVQDGQAENQYADTYMMDEADVESGNAFNGENRIFEFFFVR